MRKYEYGATVTLSVPTGIGGGGSAGAAAGSTLNALAVVDRYDPKPDDAAARVSLTLRLRFVDPERTLEAAEVDGSVVAVVARLRELGAEIRGV